MKISPVLFAIFIIVFYFSTSLAIFASENGTDSACPKYKDLHCKMLSDTEEMQRLMADMEQKMQHHMPKMKQHCKMLGAMEYMAQRMDDIKSKMEYCLKAKKPCEFPEVIGELRGMKESMTSMKFQVDAMAKSVQSIKEQTGNGKIIE